MAEVQNDTDEDVDYAVDEGPNVSGLRKPNKSLRRGQVVTVTVSSECFDVSFFKKGETEDPLISEEGIQKDSCVTLRCPAKNHWEIEVRPTAKA